MIITGPVNELVASGTAHRCGHSQNVCRDAREPTGYRRRRYERGGVIGGDGENVVALRG